MTVLIRRPKAPTEEPVIGEVKGWELTPNRRLALELISEATEAGRSDKELRADFEERGLSGGSGSGAGSWLHRRGLVKLLRDVKRNGNRPYVLPRYVLGRALKPVQHNKIAEHLCSNCGAVCTGEVRIEDDE